MDGAEVRLFFRSMFIVTATILGLGILALPVKVCYSGLQPFLVTFTLALVCQCALICIVVELLQRTEEAFSLLPQRLAAVADPSELLAFGRSQDSDPTPGRSPGAAAPAGGSPASSGTSPFPPRSKRYGKERVDSEPSAFVSQTWRGRATPLADDLSNAEPTGPSLHTMAQCFLPNRTLRGVFDFCVYMHFLIVMIAYSISAANAVTKLLPVQREAVLALFVVLLSALVVYADFFLHNAIAAFTFFKASLLVTMIAIVFWIASQVRLEHANDWSRLGDAFLIGTVSLGGSVNVLPVIYASFPRTPKSILVFRNGCLAGTVLCWLLNVMWTACLLAIVPQTAPPGEPSLSHAYRQNDISSVPLLEYLAKAYPQFTFVAVLVNVFIIISVTVSFISLGLGLKHYVDGALTSALLLHGEPNNARISSYSLLSTWLGCTTLAGVSPNILVSRGTLTNLAYLLSFGTILIIALFFSRSLYVVLEVFNSALLNIETGLFMAYMAYTTRLRPGAPDEPVAVQLSRSSLTIAVGMTMAYFGGAVFYDVVVTAGHILSSGSLM
ncbi:hypothetical protein DIPPA_13992 [Diplonema papillatum]|nr:hypothetical protein DIPPA_13992 [Diplonema papillatum]|eukprot:gene7788-11976_t